MRNFFRSHNVLNTLNLILRAAVWKSTPQPSAASLSTLFVFTFVSLAVGLANQYFAAGAAAARFSPYGLNASLAIILVTFAVTAMFVRPQERMTVFAALFGLGSLYALAGAAIALGRKMLSFEIKAPSFWTSHYTGILIFLIYAVALVGRSYVFDFPKRRAAAAPGNSARLCALAGAARRSHRPALLSDIPQPRFRHS
jgi:hypothetical protein